MYGFLFAKRICSPCTSEMKFIDVAVNLTDEMFSGIYNKKLYHQADIDAVLRRANQIGIQALIVTGTCLQESKKALELCRYTTGKESVRLFCTVGVHPTNAVSWTSTSLQDLESIIQQDELKQVVALGEMGLDYERTNFASIDQQQLCFRNQLQIVKKFPHLPLFLHSRASSTCDLLRIIKEECVERPRGVVHSFDGTKEEMQQIIDAGFCISLNGCSLRTEHNLEIARQIPLDKLLLETDAPWCQIKRSHASFQLINTTEFPTTKKSKHSHEALVEGRNEPCNIL